MSDVYNSTTVPHGARLLALYSAAGSDLGDYKWENITITRPATKIERKGVDAAAADWVAVRGYPTLSGTLQLPTSATDWPLAGNYILDTFDLGQEEKFVLLEPAPGLVAGDYHKINVTAHADLLYSPSARWPLISDALAVTGFHHLIPNGAAFSSGSLLFDGVDDYATVADATELNVANDFTITAAIKCAAARSSERCIIYKVGVIGAGYLIKINTSGFLEVVLGSDVFANSTAADDDVWNHIALVVTGTAAGLYLNGVLSASTTLTLANDFANEGSLLIGDTEERDMPFAGRIKNVRIYQRNLHPTEISAVMTADL